MMTQKQNNFKYGILFTESPGIRPQHIMFETKEERNEFYNKIVETGEFMRPECYWEETVRPLIVCAFEAADICHKRQTVFGEFDSIVIEQAE